MKTPIFPGISPFSHMGTWHAMHQAGMGMSSSAPNPSAPVDTYAPARQSFMRQITSFRLNSFPPVDMLGRLATHVIDMATMPPINGVHPARRHAIEWNGRYSPYQGPNCAEAALSAVGYKQLAGSHVGSDEFTYYLKREFKPVEDGSAQIGDIAEWSKPEHVGVIIGKRGGRIQLFHKRGLKSHTPYSITWLDEIGRDEAPTYWRQKDFEHPTFSRNDPRLREEFLPTIQNLIILLSREIAKGGGITHDFGLIDAAYSVKLNVKECLKNPRPIDEALLEVPHGFAESYLRMASLADQYLAVLAWFGNGGLESAEPVMEITKPIPALNLMLMSQSILLTGRNGCVQEQNFSPSFVGNNEVGRSRPKRPVTLNARMQVCTAIAATRKNETGVENILIHLTPTSHRDILAAGSYTESQRLHQQYIRWRLSNPYDIGSSDRLAKRFYLCWMLHELSNKDWKITLASPKPASNDRHELTMRDVLDYLIDDLGYDFDDIRTKMANWVEVTPDGAVNTRGVAP